MRRLHRILSALALWLGASSEARTQVVGDVAVRLGEGQAAVLARLRTRYLVTEDHQGLSIWSVSDTTKWSETRFVGNVGSVQFENGTVISVSRVWQLPALPSLAMPEQFVALLEQLDGQKNCKIQMHRASGPETRTEMTTVDCGAHTVSILKSEGAGRAWYSMTESWFRV